MNTPMRRRRWLVATAVAALATGGGLPARAAGTELLAALSGLRILVPTLAGGTLDLLGRVLAHAFGQHHQLVLSVLNIEGAAGEIALRRLLAEPPDGRTWLLAQESLITINPSLYPRSSPDILDGLAPVARIATSSFYLLVRADDPITSMRDLLHEARAAVSPLAYGSGGIGTLHHLSTEALAAGLDLKLLHVPYRGNSQAVQALVRGDIRMLMAGSSALGLVESGRLRMLALTAPRRMATLPDVPALAEWLPGFQAANWFGLFARKSVPELLLADMRGLLQQLLDSDEVRRQVKDRGNVDTGYLAGRAFLEQITDDRQRYAEVVRRLALAAPK